MLNLAVIPPSPSFSLLLCTASSFPKRLPPPHFPHQQVAGSPASSRSRLRCTLTQQHKAASPLTHPRQLSCKTTTGKRPIAAAVPRSPSSSHGCLLGPLTAVGYCKAIAPPQHHLVFTPFFSNCPIVSLSSLL